METTNRISPYRVTPRVRRISVLTTGCRDTQSRKINF